MGGDTYYEILGVPPTATSEEIRVRYRQLILRIHPDVDGPPALFRQVQQAYEVLSDPVRRSSYDRVLSHIDTRTLHRADQGSKRSSATTRRTLAQSRRHPAAPFALAGVILLVFASFAQPGMALILLGLAALVVAGVAALGTRGTKECEAYRRSGIAAIDAMSARQFEALLEHFFAKRGYRVARIRVRRVNSGPEFLLTDVNGRIVVHASRRTSVVPPDAVQEVVAHMDHYGASRAIVVATSSDYSPHAITVAQAKGVTLWNRAMLATELTALSGEPLQPAVKRLSSELRAGSRICVGSVSMLFVLLFAMRTRLRRSHSGERHTAS